MRAYARSRGVSHVAVLKALQAGRIPKEPDGTIDPAKADAAWDGATDPARLPAKAAAKPIPKPAAPASPAPVLSEERTSPIATGNATFSQARTAHEIAKAQRTRIQVQQLKSEVVDRTRAMALVFKLARQERDAWVNWPARVAALMAAELGVEPHRLQQVLDAQVRAHLEELADVRPDFL